ncbi:MAG: DUF2378 family protein [Polyangiaceae bacterium]|nr:DUF2378 family protein [Myxococcales bacterium]MCB9589502.1 DUF2378 family protein [Polyangiaceae bacterium]MCB9609931.1 DUF2378 family protein [Polyangiaceae bacterium]
MIPASDFDWGERVIDPAEAEAFAAQVEVTSRDRERIRRVLSEFPVACQVRGMFFQGLVDTIARSRTYEVAKELVKRGGVRTRFVPFSLMPHRDFYKLYFLASAVLYPGSPLETGFERIAEDFYPVFRSSMVGRTISAFIGSEPITVLERLAQAYRVSIPWNEHDVEAEGARGARWRCKVEPSDLYPATFRGIIRGTMQSHGVSEPTVDLVDSSRQGDAIRYVFAIQWS